MKTMFPPRPGMRRGFTLIEIMVSITIIAMLAGLSLIAMRYANQISSRKKTEAYLKAIELYLDRYRNDNGVYPRPKSEDSDGKSVTVRGNDYPVDGAVTLYQALTGDGDDAIEGGESPSEGKLQSIKGSVVYWGDADPNGANRITRQNDGAYYIADGFGAPFQYKVPPPYNPKKPEEFQQTKLQYRNPRTYDLWSYAGEAPLGGDDVQSANDTTWVKNW